MEDEYLDEQEDKSLLKDVAKNAISKKIKVMPLKTKLILFGVCFGIVFFLLIFIVLASTLFMLFDGDAGAKNESDFIYIDTNSEDNFWWPIGGAEVEVVDGVQFAIGEPSTVNITSYYDPGRVIDGVYSPHYAIDIGGSGNTDYVIAITKGIVYSVGTGCDNNGSFGNACNDGLGNYVILEHANSIFTMYAHLYPGSLTVNIGDSVNQGQVIAQVGNSGSSTGKHLHFQLEVGGRGQQFAVDPLGYVSPDNPRPVTIDNGYSGNNQLLGMLRSWEGTGPTDGENYVVYMDKFANILTVGHGVTLIYNSEKFASRGIDIEKISENDRLPMLLVDEIELEILSEQRSRVINKVNGANISLNEEQIDALIIRMYNVGNIEGFVDNYKRYGNTQALYDNFMGGPVTSGGTYLEGLVRRRQAEWKLFHEGIYTFNS